MFPTTAKTGSILSLHGKDWGKMISEYVSQVIIFILHRPKHLNALPLYLLVHLLLILAHGYTHRALDSIKYG